MRLNSDLVDVLVIEDSPTAAKLVELWLQSGLNIPNRVRNAHTLAAAKAQLALRPADVIVLYLHLPDSEGLNTFRTIQDLANETPIVIMSGESDEEIAVVAVREGAQDYVVKRGYEVNPLARPVRFALERVRRQRAEAKLRETSHQLQLAHATQEHLFPNVPPIWPGFDIAGRCTASDSVAGDYFDFISMDGGLLGIVIGDVSGHGFSSALLMASVRAVLRTLTRTCNGSGSRSNDVGDLLTTANEIISPDLTDDRFISLLFASLDPRSRRLRYASAGQPAYLLDMAGHLKVWLESTATLLGVEENRIEASPEISFAAGDLLVLYTDGITESEGGDGVPFGEERMLNVVRKYRHLPAKQIVDNVLEAAKTFAQPSAQHDDMTLVIVKVEALQ